jgi:hypothetical protein
MSREAFLQLCHKIRAIPSSPAFDILTTKVEIVTHTWTSVSGNNVRSGVPVETRVEIIPRPRIIEQGDTSVLIRIVQPSSALGGYGPTTLVPQPSSTSNVETLFALTFPDGVERLYTQARLVTDKAFHYEVELSGLDRKYPH